MIVAKLQNISGHYAVIMTEMGSKGKKDRQKETWCGH